MTAWEPWWLLTNRPNLRTPTPRSWKQLEGAVPDVPLEGLDSRLIASARTPDPCTVSTELRQLLPRSSG